VATVLSVNDHTPRIADGAFLADTAVVAGDVELADGVSIWFGTVVRSETSSVRIGADSNVQDLTAVHTDPGSPVTIGERVTIGHRCVIHGCTIEDDALIGMGAVVMNGARVGRGALVAAGAVVTEGTEIPEMSLAVGVPAKVIDRPVPDIPRPNVEGYLTLAAAFREAQRVER
jgi:carbonic anhydrase/acetyltransferase-like protein (isoleucine patch superfamily)